VLDVEALRDLDIGVAPVEHARRDMNAPLHEQAHQRRSSAGATHDQRPQTRGDDRLIRRAEDHGGSSRRGARLDVRVDPVDGSEQRSGDDLLRLAVGDDLAGGHRDEPVREGRREGQVVQHRDHRDLPLVGETPDHLVELHDVPDVEVRRGLVQEEDRRILRERLREHGSAPLPAGELVHRPVRQVLDAYRLHRLPRLRPVPRTSAGPPRQVRSSPHQHELQHVERERRDHVLRNHGNETRGLLRRHRVRIAPRETNRPG
jgi:hypothetical protein